MRDDILESLKNEVRRRCESKNNHFGIGGYYHIVDVVRKSIILAQKNNADIEVVAISAWLHDIAAITDYKFYNDHHLHGVRIAGDILSSYDYPKDKIQKVQKCILNHRSVKSDSRSSVEEICVADADGITNFENLPALFQLAYQVEGCSIKEGAEFVKNKLINSYSKLSETSKQIYKEKYDIAMKVMES
ncbi:uncharacterized protein J2Z44_001878 [Clostridium punense]|uniref:HD domain-containing protein n=1 Tax=Clostridium punense TaxID=1054297 RepID=A0ABS4K2R1_9CLOT|nr:MULTISPECIES: HD domain-containing protein [Clostridium]EQB87631.1 hypothetical protein M918_08030 [Clostridium sp. BL8]MBP2022077.1 uncharacterized protein [Clostridium punense]